MGAKALKARPSLPSPGEIKLLIQNLNIVSFRSYSSVLPNSEINQTASAEEINSGAVKVFPDLVNQLEEITEFLKGKSGIYCF